MKIRTQIFILAGLAFLVVTLASQVKALEMNVDQRGTLRFYQNEILGKNTQGGNTGAGSQVQASPVKTVPSYEGKEVRVRVENQGSEVELKEKTATNQVVDDSNFTGSEKMNDENLRLEFPAVGGQPAMEGQQGVTQNQQGDTEGTQARAEYMSQVQTERQERQGEMIEIKNRAREQKQILEIESRNVRAELQEGAEFKLDPNTNQVSIITPSGQEKILNHLPDQAIDRMLAAGLIEDNNVEDELKIKTVEGTEEDQVVYETTSTQRRRLFGLFPRTVETAVSLNDDTGEIDVEMLPAPTYFGQVLDTFTF